MKSVFSESLLPTEKHSCRECTFFWALDSQFSLIKGCKKHIPVESKYGTKNYWKWVDEHPRKKNGCAFFKPK